ncbi:MAG: branched-chain amino acid ABC transporter substrate-binding protein [Alphaproteobacteria bacterium]|nr:branched-chain amino acid ABC transporter substrate-binding protein [Alphaproteobacteria bacterium]
MQTISKIFVIALLATGFATVAHADIRIAFAIPLTGSETILGEEIRHGAELAAESINAKGGVLGQKIILDYQDDVCNATQATVVANKIVTTPPVAVIGDLCSAATLASSPIYNEANIPQLTFSSNATITQKGFKNLFRLIGSDDIQAPMLANYVIKEMAGKDDKVAVIDDKSSWGMGFADSAEKTLRAKNTKVGMRDSVNVGQKDYASLITKLKEDKITHVILGLLHVEAGLLIRQAREQGFKGAFFGGDPIQTPEFWKIAGTAAEGFQQTGPFDPQYSDQGKAIVANLKKANKSIGIYTFYGYAAVETITQAITKANSVKNDAVIAALRKEQFDTLLGSISFDAIGELKNFVYQLSVWHDGNYVPVK